MFAAAPGIVDHTSRLAAGVLETACLPGARESMLYLALVRGPGADRLSVPLLGPSQPIVLLVISACVGAR
jgi:hypothetical protein